MSRISSGVCWLVLQTPSARVRLGNGWECHRVRVKPSSRLDFRKFLSDVVSCSAQGFHQFSILTTANSVKGELCSRNIP